MTAQMTQFSQLAQLESINSNFSEVLKTAEQSQAVSLIGKNVTFVGETEDGGTDIMTGKVEQVANNDGKVLLGVGNHTLTLDDIIGVSNTSGS